MQPSQIVSGEQFVNIKTNKNSIPLSWTEKKLIRLTRKRRTNEELHPKQYSTEADEEEAPLEGNSLEYEDRHYNLLPSNGGYKPELKKLNPKLSESNIKAPESTFNMLDPMSIREGNYGSPDSLSIEQFN